jgi:hypothetical protein
MIDVRVQSKTFMLFYDKLMPRTAQTETSHAVVQVAATAEDTCQTCQNFSYSPPGSGKSGSATC